MRFWVLAALVQVQRRVQQRVESDADKWWLVEEVAELYREEYNESCAKRAADSFLAPLGLNLETFVQKQQQCRRNW